ncbi:MAG: transglutaminase domain-containing protein [Desulfobacteraceae bacterium]|nr:MAG: transglutaminase domain-containing protein [Desulfobacteraceae bacterium]
MNDELSIYLTATSIIDSDHPEIGRFAESVVDGLNDPVEMAVALYYAVRDGIRYDPYCPFYRADHYRASSVLKSGRGYCVSKASVLCAAARACGIPTRLGFADVRNHLSTRQLRQYMGTDLFVYHGFNELFLVGKWVKATPAFNKELCLRHRVLPLEFNGREDSLFHAFNLDSLQFMEYVRYHGVFADVPVSSIVQAWREAYGERVDNWINSFETIGAAPGRDFHEEDILT